jgi:hypothetical protein
MFSLEDPKGGQPMSITRIAAVLFALVLVVSAAQAEDKSDCAAAPRVLWGDGEHDDTAALNAWFRGETVTWADTHEPVDAEIADRTFLLNSAVYISSGTGRKLERFRMIWPERNETVSGGTILAGKDPDQPPVAHGITMIGADPDEGVPYETPDLETREHGIPKHCFTS